MEFMSTVTKLYHTGIEGAYQTTTFALVAEVSETASRGRLGEEQKGGKYLVQQERDV
jgi:hypothetical protein